MGGDWTVLGVVWAEIHRPSDRRPGVDVVASAAEVQHAIRQGHRVVLRSGSSMA
jgi:hypothetical protein